MSRTTKDLKSHKQGFGEWHHKPQRKMTPFIHDANKIAGKNEVLTCLPDDISQDGFNTGEHWHNAKAVRSIRRQEREARKLEKSTARARIKHQDKNDINNLES